MSLLQWTQLTVDDLIAIGDRVANEANYEEYPDFEKAVDALVCAYEEKFPLQRKGSFSIISLDNDQTEDTIKKTPLVQKLPPKNLFFVQIPLGPH